MKMNNSHTCQRGSETKHGKKYLSLVICLWICVFFVPQMPNTFSVFHVSALNQLSQEKKLLTFHGKSWLFNQSGSLFHG